MRQNMQMGAVSDQHPAHLDLYSKAAWTCAFHGAERSRRLPEQTPSCFAMLLPIIRIMTTTT